MILVCASLAMAVGVGCGAYFSCTEAARPDRQRG